MYKLENTAPILTWHLFGYLAIASIKIDLGRVSDEDKQFHQTDETRLIQNMIQVLPVYTVNGVHIVDPNEDFCMGQARRIDRGKYIWNKILLDIAWMKRHIDSNGLNVGIMCQVKQITRTCRKVS